MDVIYDYTLKLGCNEMWGRKVPSLTIILSFRTLFPMDHGNYFLIENLLPEGYQRVTAYTFDPVT